ncbi:sigma-70 family RNA polymerase sigma factor [bacterium]|nr:sigma-70 family RNA polymerase sigma factor [bacterium]
MMQLSDIQIIEKVINGDKSAFNELMDRHEKSILNFTYRLLSSRTEAEDITQEVFLRAYKNIETFESRAKFSTWLFKIARNLCLNKLRHTFRFPTFSIDKPIRGSEHDFQRQVENKKQVSPASSLLKKELQDTVKAALGSLPKNQKAAVVLRRYEDMSYKEISTVMGCSVSAVRSMLNRAKQTLKNRLKHYAQK